MSAFDDARSLVQHAQDELPKIRQAYDESLAAKTIAPRLLVEIKNVCENLRSALDFVAHGLFDRHCTASAKKAKIYFPYATAKRSRAEFENSGRIEACMNTLFQFVRWEQDMKPTYFDLSVHDVAKAKAFFEHVLHWDFERFEMPYEYYRIKAGPESEIRASAGMPRVLNRAVSSSDSFKPTRLPDCEPNAATSCSALTLDRRRQTASSCSRAQPVALRGSPRNPRYRGGTPLLS